MQLKAGFPGYCLTWGPHRVATTPRRSRSTPMRQINAATLDDIARGAAVLGTGGGGDPYTGKLMAQRSLREQGEVSLIDPLELDDDDLIIPAGMMGAPTVMV